MPTVLRHINRIFRRTARENQNNNNNNNSNSNNIHMHGYKPNNMHCSSDSEMFSEMNAIKLKSTGYERQNDGSVKLSLRLDKDQVECCVCLTSMTDKIYRCRGNINQSNPSNNNKQPVCHNICASCNWNMTRMKASNGHTKQMQCPICKIKGPFIRNYALERQLTELSNVCTHNKFGCEEKFFPWDSEPKDAHEKHLCVYQPIDCPFCHQSIIGGRINFIEHLVKSVKISEENEYDSEDSDISSENNENENENENENDMDDAMHVEESQSMIDEIMINNENEEIIHSSDSEQIEQEEENNNKKKIEINSKNSILIENNNKHTVPGCTIPFYKAELQIIDAIQTERNIIKRNRNEFIVNYNLGIVACFIAPTNECKCWKVYCISINPRHTMGGNSRVYVQYSDYDKMSKFIEKEKSLGVITTSCLNRPCVSTLILSLNRLHPTSLRKIFDSYSIPPMLSVSDNNNMNDESDTEIKEDEKMQLDNNSNNKLALSLTESELDDLDEYKPEEYLGKSPCSKIEYGFIYGGHEQIKGSIMNKLSIRIFTLEESFKVGSIIDARDFTGKWYQVEIIAVQDFNGKIYDNLDNDNNDYLEIRKAKIHYLGYSQNYDEWLNIDTDSHRIAHRGTFTIGPDLRAVRRNTTTIHNNNNNANNHQLHNAINNSN